ncbi:MAG: 3-hydroxylacyl-ACP dehydratase [Halofilum sp. (in: g-proteobacteria)]|nr:3-hydroxylacyl-ACP dehydratase [Halofilum sp. (in: g-proteobacteria)]
MTDRPATLDRAAIEGLIPHAGSMCLLEHVVQWDRESIECRTRTQLETDNPLRVDGGVPIEAGIEYAAQAMAVHGGLGDTGGDGPRRGFVAVVNRVSWNAEWLDDESGELSIHAHALQGGDDGRQYAFRIERGDRTLIEGTALVVLESRD